MTEGHAGATLENEVLAIGHPHGGGIEIDIGGEILDGAGGDVVNHDEAVVDASRDEGDFASVGRPFGIALDSPFCDESLLAAIDGGSRFRRREFGAVDLAFFDKQHGTAVWREFGIGGIGDAPGRPTGSASGPDGMFGTIGIGGGIRGPAGAVGGFAAQEDDGAAVIGDANGGHHDTVVLHEIGEANGSKKRCNRGVGVALAFGVIDPGDAVGLFGGDEFLGRGGA